MPADKQGGQGTQKSGEPINQNRNVDNPQPRQQRDQGQNREEQEQQRIPGGGKGNR